MKIEIYYDKECPFCNSYANYIKIKEDNELKLFNVRESKKQVQIFKENGYQGADAILFLNKVSEKKVLFLDNRFFKTYLYSFIKQLRKLILFLKKKNIDI
ncbi:MAG: hypothetical protein ACPGUI_08355 [Halarcobacter sp.]